MSDITWEQVQAVYPDIPLDELQADLASYGYDKGFGLEHLEFEVVTEGCWVNACGPTSAWERVDEPVFWPFDKGGILLVTASGREPFGPGRKVRKWWVGSEVVPTYAQALEISERVKSEPTKGYGDPSDYDFLFEEKGI